MTAEHMLDTNQRYVRVIDRRADGFVEFTFAVGEPDLAVELLMNTEAFDDFCTVNQVTVLAADPGGDAWGLHDARSWTSHDSDTGA